MTNNEKFDFVVSPSTKDKNGEPYDPLLYGKRYRENAEKLSNSSQPQIKCPTCSSTNVQKIDGLERMGSVAMWGLFSKKINKSFKCNNCKYTW